MINKKTSKITNYTREEATEILGTIKECVKNDQYDILRDDQTRNDNKMFIETYGIGREQQKNILLGIEVSDFCYGLHNTRKGYEHEIWYVFCPLVELFAYDTKIVIGIYIKINILGKERIIVVSFHENHDTITYLFN